MPYIWVALLTVGFASGYGLSSALSHAEIQHMSDGITAQNREAEIQLATLTEKADKAYRDALKAKQDLEDANVSTINAINSQRDAFKSVRMYDNGRKSSSCPTTQSGNTSTTTNTSDDGRLSEDLTEFLKSEAYRADQVSAYAILCKKFVLDNNCGVAK
jgi:hypothetical protein